MVKYKCIKEIYSKSQKRLIKVGDVLDIEDKTLADEFAEFMKEIGVEYYELVKEEKPKRAKKENTKEEGVN